MSFREKLPCRESNANNESHRWADAPVAGSPNAGNTQVYARAYTYDKVGNIQSLQQSGTNAFTRTFNYTDNTLDDISVSGSPTPFTYDANGNLLTSGSSRFYDWNPKDQLSFFKIQAGGTPSVYAHYLYDAGGNRVKKIVWDQQEGRALRNKPVAYFSEGASQWVGEVTVYIDGIFEYRLKQEDGDDKEQNIIHIMPARPSGGDDNARIAQKRIGTVFNDDIAETIHYVLDDHLGSSNTRLDSTGSIIDHQEFYPFGDTSLRTFSKKRYQYIGREKDAESGLHYWSARYYSSWMCRFISVDKLASSYAQLTPYNYADNDPINDFDIDGNQNSNTEQRPSGGGSVKKGDTFVGDDGKTHKASVDEIEVTGTKSKHLVTITKTIHYKEPTMWQNFKGWLEGIDKSLRGDAYWTFGIEFKTNDGVMRGDPSAPNPVKPENFDNVITLYWDDIEDLAGAFTAISKDPKLTKNWIEQAEDFVDSQKKQVGTDDLKKTNENKTVLQKSTTKQVQEQSTQKTNQVIYYGGKFKQDSTGILYYRDSTSTGIQYNRTKTNKPGSGIIPSSKKEFKNVMSTYE